MTQPTQQPFSSLVFYPSQVLSWHFKTSFIIGNSMSAVEQISKGADVINDLLELNEFRGWLMFSEDKLGVALSFRKQNIAQGYL